MPGPAPNPNARRPNRHRGGQSDWRTLPAAGRTGNVPPFPYGRMSKALDSLWEDLWRTPQAAAWEDLGWTRTVGRYARMLLAAEAKDAPTSLLGEVRQMEDRLGLNPMSLRKLLWRIDEAPAEAAQPSEGVTQLDDYRGLYGAG